MPPISPLSPRGSSAPITPSSTAKQPTIDMGNGLNEDSFLQLLVTQLKYQNPSEPMDPSQLMNSTAQLTMVDKINELVALSKGENKVAMASLGGTLVGKKVTYLDATSGGNVTGLVQSARIDGETLMLRINNKEIDFATVSEISLAS
jgi:flagellar basal-body rod modification protein FlgD